MPMQLLGICKASFYGFLSPSVYLLSLFRVAVAVDPVFMVLPDVLGNYFGEVRRPGALGLKWACPALCGT